VSESLLLNANSAIFTLFIQEKNLTLIVLVQKWQLKPWCRLSLKIRVGKVKKNSAILFSLTRIGHNPKFQLRPNVGENMNTGI